MDIITIQLPDFDYHLLCLQLSSTIHGWFYMECWRNRWHTCYSTIACNGVSIISLVHGTKHIDRPFEYLTIRNPNIKKFGIQMFLPINMVGIQIPTVIQLNSIIVLRVAIFWLRFWTSSEKTLATLYDWLLFHIHVYSNQSMLSQLKPHWQEKIILSAFTINSAPTTLKIPYSAWAFASHLNIYLFVTTLH